MFTNSTKRPQTTPKGVYKGLLPFQPISTHVLDFVQWPYPITSAVPGGGKAKAWGFTLKKSRSPDKCSSVSSHSYNRHWARMWELMQLIQSIAIHQPALSWLFVWEWGKANLTINGCSISVKEFFEFFPITSEWLKKFIATFFRDFDYGAILMEITKHTNLLSSDK